MALSIGTPGRQASSASSPDLSNYVDRTSTQSIAGNKTASGLWTFTAPFNTAQAKFGSVGQGGRLDLIEGTSGTSAFTISYFNSTSLGAIIQGNSSSGLVVRNTGSTGYVGLEATGASGFLNFISGNSQSMRLFSNGNLRIGASAVDSGNKLQVDGNSGFAGGVTVAGNIVPDVTNIRAVGTSSSTWGPSHFSQLLTNIIRPLTSAGLSFFNQTGSTQFHQFFNNGNVSLGTGAPTDDLSGLQLKHSITASSGIARGMNITSTLTSAANNDVLAGLDINPTFVNGGGHSVVPVPLRVMGVITGAGAGEGIRITRPGFPSQFLSINESDGVVHNLTGNNNKVFQISSTGGTGAHVSLLSNAIERLRVEGSGPVMIQNGGTFTNSGEQLQVVGSTKLDGAVTATGLLTATGGVSSSTYGATGVTRISFNNTSETGNINMASYGSGLAGALVGITPTLNGASVSQKSVSILPTINQSGTSAYTILYASVYEQATGSGTKNLIDVGTNTAANNSGTHTSRFSVSNIGKVNSVDDFETTVIGKGFILKSPNGTRYRISVDNAGIVTAVAA